MVGWRFPLTFIVIFINYVMWCDVMWCDDVMSHCYVMLRHVTSCYVISHVWGAALAIVEVLSHKWNTDGSQKFRHIALFKVQQCYRFHINVHEAQNSHIWQSLSLRDGRWKAAVTLGWMGATFSGSSSWPPRSATSTTLCAQRWCGKFTLIAALLQHCIFLMIFVIPIVFC